MVSERSRQGLTGSGMTKKAATKAALNERTLALIQLARKKKRKKHMSIPATTTERLTSLDSLRGIAILMVIAGHTAGLTAPQSEWLVQFSRLGARGVQLFYVVSAFSLFLSFRARSQSGGFSYAGYFIRRLARIAPMFWLSIALYLAVYGMKGNYWAPDGLTPISVFLTAIFMHGWHPTSINSVVPGGWSVAVESTFYILLPICFIWVRSMNGALIATAMCLIARHALGVWYMSTFGGAFPASQTYLPYSFAWIFWTPAQLPVFMLGIVLFFLRDRLASIHRDVTMCFFAGAIVLITISQYSTVEAMLPDQFVAAIGFMLLCIAAIDGKFRILDNIALQTIGRLSFSIYLLHGMILHLSQKPALKGLALMQLDRVPDLAYPVSFVAIAVMSSAVAAVTYRFIEQPGMAFGARIAKLAEGRQPSKHATTNVTIPRAEPAEPPI